MTKRKETFASLLSEFEYRYDLRTVFNDFLTLTLCAFSQNPETKKSYDEDLYMETIAPYKDNPLRHNFPKMLAYLTLEMTERMDSGEGNDVLGEFYETHLAVKGKSQYFTPWPLCKFMALATMEQVETVDPQRSLRILDPACGSGRILLAAIDANGTQHEYYGIDIDHTCVKMTALNLFLRAVSDGEVLCADALAPNDFVVSYAIRFPYGVRRITEADNSYLRLLLSRSIGRGHDKTPQPTVDLPSEKYGTAYRPDGDQLILF